MSVWAVVLRCGGTDALEGIGIPTSSLVVRTRCVSLSVTPFGSARGRGVESATTRTERCGASWARWKLDSTLMNLTRG